jgi:hypothetical protein
MLFEWVYRTDAKLYSHCTGYVTRLWEPIHAFVHSGNYVTPVVNKFIQAVLSPYVYWYGV